MVSLSQRFAQNSPELVFGFDADRFQTSKTCVAVAHAHDDRVRHTTEGVQVRVTAVKRSPKSLVHVTRVACERRRLIGVTIAALECQTGNAR